MDGISAACTDGPTEWLAKGFNHSSSFLYSLTGGIAADGEFKPVSQPSDGRQLYGPCRLCGFHI